MPEIVRAPATVPGPGRNPRPPTRPTPYAKVTRLFAALYVACLVAALVADYTGHDGMPFIVAAIGAFLAALAFAIVHELRSRTPLTGNGNGVQDQR